MVHFAVSMVTMGTTSKALGFIPLHFSETCSLENQTFFSCVVVCVCVCVCVCVYQFPGKKFAKNVCYKGWWQTADMFLFRSDGA